MLHGRAYGKRGRAGDHDEGHGTRLITYEELH